MNKEQLEVVESLNHAFNACTFYTRSFNKTEQFVVDQVVSSSIVDKYIGESARLIREMFNYARDHQPCIIFMDEIDAIGKTIINRVIQTILIKGKINDSLKLNGKCGLSLKVAVGFLKEHQQIERYRGH